MDPSIPNDAKRLKSRDGTALRRQMRRMMLWMAASVLLRSASALGQDLMNSGQIDNTGTIRVKNQVVGLPPVVDGTFEFFGTNQTVPARQYNDLVLTGSGTKSTSGGSFSVSGNIAVDPGVVLDVESGETITLIGNLNEQGYLRGAIGKTVNLTGGLTTSNFGNIGATVSWSGNPPGQTTITRVSGIASTGNGNQSVLRYYDIAPTFATGLNGSLTLKYSENELNGHDPVSLELWRSPDNGATWRRQGGVVDTAQKTVMKTGVVAFSRWTLSDRLLGPAAYEWVASSLAVASGDGQSGPTGTTLSPFTVTITDFFGNPIAGVSVTFAFSSVPTGATGQSLSTTLVTTNASGQASTTLTLGDKPGTYAVTASSTGLTGSPASFTATATSAAAAMLLVGGNGQQDTIRSTLNPFTIRINDGSGNPVPGVNVSFGLLSQPAGAAGTALSDTLVVTNASGIAASYLTLGDKVGSYQVRATTIALPGIQADFTAQARAGTAALITAASGTTAQQDTILQQLDSLYLVRLTDSGSNPVPGVTVQFTITNTPVGATGQALSASSVTTNAAGEAATRLTLGSKVGTYEVTATTGSLAPRTFSAQALTGAAALLAEVEGNGQQKTVTSVLDTSFTVRITDIGGNPISGAPVQFSILTAPAGAVGMGLSTTADTTDTNGDAATTLTLGTIAGNYVVVARSAVLPGDSTLFTARAVAAAATSALAASGDGQTQPAGAVLPQPFVVTVTDSYGNPVSGASVQFSIASAPAGATGQLLTPATSVTDANGQAQSVLRLGNLPGTYSVTATVTGIPSVTFTATASFILADINSDFDVNIADLTSIIDHILQVRTLSGLDSAKADVNRDGAINVLDVVALQNALLGASQLVKVDQQASPQRSASAMRTAAATITGSLEITPLGVRLNLTNDVPIKGLQVGIVLASGAGVNRTDVVFPRGRMMEYYVNSTGSEIRMVAYNLNNIPIDTGSGSIIRLPLMLADTSEVDSAYVVVSTADTTFDLAVRVQLSTVVGIYPATFRLAQNYPNPFNAETNIEFEVPDVQGKLVRAFVQVFNLLGEKVKTLARGEHAAGTYRVVWDGTDDQGYKVPSGVYFYRLIATDYVSAKRMVLIK
ncbi:MAG: Ig-like domain-containing protein [Ignavibacterium sp.]